MNKSRFAILVTFSFAMFSTSVSAHSGGTDAYGCHNNWKTGGYHCHNPKRLPQFDNGFGRSAYDIDLVRGKWIRFPNSIYQENPWKNNVILQRR